MPYRILVIDDLRTITPAYLDMLACVYGEIEVTNAQWRKKTRLLTHPVMLT